MSWLPSPKIFGRNFWANKHFANGNHQYGGLHANSLTLQNPPEGVYDEKSWKMMAGNRVIFSASGVPNLLEIGSKPIYIFFSCFFFFSHVCFFSSGHSGSHIMTCAGSNYVIGDFTMAMTDGAIIQVVLIKWCGVCSNQWIINDCFGMCITLWL